MLLFSNNIELISFESEELLSVSELNDFAYDLNYLYDNLFYFHSLFEGNNRSLYEFEDQATHYVEMKDAKAPALFTILRREISYNKRKLRREDRQSRRGQLDKPFTNDGPPDLPWSSSGPYELIIYKMILNSPGYFDFLGGINPINSLTKLISVVKENNRENAKLEHQKKLDNAKLKRADERHEIEKRKAEQEATMKDQEIILGNIEIARQTSAFLKSQGYSPEEINRVIQKLLGEPAKRLVTRNSKFNLRNKS